MFSALRGLGFLESRHAIRDSQILSTIRSRKGTALFPDGALAWQSTTGSLYLPCYEGGHQMREFRKALLPCVKKTVSKLGGTQ